jgi:hypothetical protein
MHSLCLNDEGLYFALRLRMASTSAVKLGKRDRLAILPESADLFQIAGALKILLKTNQPTRFRI